MINPLLFSSCLASRHQKKGVKAEEKRGEPLIVVALIIAAIIIFLVVVIIVAADHIFHPGVVSIIVIGKCGLTGCKCYLIDRKRVLKFRWPIILAFGAI